MVGGGPLARCRDEQPWGAVPSIVRLDERKASLRAAQSCAGQPNQHTKMPSGRKPPSVTNEPGTTS